LTLNRFSIAPICLVLFSPLAQIHAQTANPYRTEMDTELGSIFTPPATGFHYSDFGAYIGADQYSTILAPRAIKGHYGHFNHFGPFDEKLGFPYTGLRNYEAQEVAAGRDPIFVTATYEGKKRPVLFNAYLGLDSHGKATTPPSSWMYAVNVADERFIKFWLNEYVRPAELLPMQKLNNVWVYLDGCAFFYAAYGVLDDNNTFIPGVPWDPPFQQNSTEYLNSIAYFFNQVAQLAPDIKINTDFGSMSDPTQFSSIYANVGSALSEDDYSWTVSPSQYVRDHYYLEPMQWLSWLAAHNRPVIVGSLYLPSNWQNGALLSAFVNYELVKGANFFFAPRTGTTSIPPSAWEGWNAALGNPVGTFQSTLRTGKGTSVSSRLFWREFTEGYVYLNMTGITQTVTLPAGKWVDPSNNPVTKLTLPTSTATFVTAARSSAVTAPAPAIEPRTPYSITGPATITIASKIPGATIHYTLDGKTPTSSSPVYSGPIELNSSAVVQAQAVASGYNPSAISSASYKVIATPPTVQFATSSDTGYSEITTCYPVLALSAIPDGPVIVTYSARPAVGAPIIGTATFLAGEVYTFFPVPVSGSVKVTITSAVGAVVGAANTFEFSN